MKKKIKAYAVLTRHNNMFRFSDGTYAVAPSKKSLFDSPLGVSEAYGKKIVEIEITIKITTRHKVERDRVVYIG